MSNIKVGVSGYNGKMGKEILNVLKQTENVIVVTEGGEVGEDKIKLFKNSDVVIDFTSARGLNECLDFAKETKVPLVSGSTPMNDELMNKIMDVSKYTKICWSANMSIGIAVVKKLSSMCGKLLNDYDCEIFERHHNKKKDAPSGTAIMLGKTIADSRGLEFDDVCVIDRNSERKLGQIGFSSVRGGNIVGDHKVMFIGKNDEIQIVHKAYNRVLFAAGAVKCALELLKQKDVKFYNIEDLLFNF